MQDDSFPANLKTLQAQDYTLKILIKDENINQQHKIFEVNGIFTGWNIKQETLEDEVHFHQTTTTTAEVNSNY